MFRHKKAFSAAILAALIAATALFTGCGGNNDNATPDEAEKETRVVTETQVVTRVVDGVYTDEDGNVIKDENGQPMTAPPGTPDTDSKGGSAQGGGNSGGNNGNAANGGNGANGGSASSSAQGGGNSANSSAGSNNSKSGGNSNSSSNSGGNSGNSGNSEKKAEPGSSTLSLGGKTYNVGDKVTCTYTLTSKKLMSNFQALINYDGKCLKATNAYLDGPAKSGSVINYELDSQIKFNGINLNGYNYTKPANFLVVEYEVIGGGSTAPEFVWQISTDTKDNPLVTKGKADTSIITLNASYS